MTARFAAVTGVSDESHSISTPPHPSRRIREAREYLEAHCAEDVPLERLARMADLSAFHFSRVFRSETGLPPHTCQNQARIARAKTLLFGGMPAAQVAALTGFADQAHLSRNFKLLVGITPRQFLQSGSLHTGRTP
jgi:transcriptional regulator GlxA family with amidase domain